jgi:hypothetical protein
MGQRAGERIREDLRPPGSDLDEYDWEKTGALVPADLMSNVSEVISEQEKVARAYERARNGIYWFNKFYLGVTRGVWDAIRENEYGPDGDRFINRLDIEFYGFYQRALCRSVIDEPVGVAWEPLFQHRDDAIHPILFALSGMNAHIVCDLAQAIVASLVRLERADFPVPGSHEHWAYLDLNEILYRVAASCLKEDFDTGAPGVIYRIFPEALVRAGDGYIEIVRDLAWEQAERLWRVHRLNQPSALQEMRLMLAASARTENNWLLRDLRLSPHIGLLEIKDWLEHGLGHLSLFGLAGPAPIVHLHGLTGPRPWE